MIARLTAIACAISGVVLAQPALALEVPVELEGTIENIVPSTDSVFVMGIEVNVPRSTPIATPTADINALAAEVGATVGRPNTKPLVLMRRFRVDGDDVLPAQLPGRSQLGFIGGTAIITGTAVLDDVTGALLSITADSMFAEPEFAAGEAQAAEGQRGGGTAGDADRAVRLRLAQGPAHDQVGGDVRLGEV